MTTLPNVTASCSGTTYLNLSNYATMVVPGATPLDVSFPPTCQEAKLVFSLQAKYNDSVSIGEPPFFESELAYFDLYGSSVGTTTLTATLGESVSGPTYSHEYGGAGGGAFYEGNALITSALVEVGEAYPLQGALTYDNASHTVTLAAVAPLVIPTPYPTPAQPPIGAPFYLEGNSSAWYLVVDPNGYNVGPSGGATFALCTGLNGYLVGQTFSSTYQFAWANKTLFFSAIMFFGAYISPDGPAGENVAVVEVMNGLGQHSASYHLTITEYPLLNFGGTVDQGFYGFQENGDFIIFDPLAQTYEKYIFTSLDSVATACLASAQTLYQQRYGSCCSNTAGSLIITTAGIWYEFTPTTQTFYAAISSPGSAPMSQALTLTSISGTHGTPLSLGGAYDYVDFSPPVALDIGYVQNDGSIEWVPASSSSIGTSTPIGMLAVTGTVLP